MRRIHGLFFTFTLFLALFSGTAWAALVCGENLPGGTSILKLASQTNSHGEVSTQSNYIIDIRCRETNLVSVGPAQANPITLLKLSTNTNAHAEIASGTNYSTLIQMGDNGAGQILMTVADSSAAVNNECDDFDSLPNIDYVELVRLSSLTNAHLQSPAYAGTAYRYRVCVAYDTTGGAAASNILDVGFSTSSATAPQGQPVNVGAITTVQVSGGAYTNIDSLQGIAVCSAADPACLALEASDYSTIRAAFLDFVTSNSTTYAGPFIPSTVQMSLYGNDYATTHSSFTTNWSSNPTNIFTSLDNQVNPHVINYTLDTTAILPGGYRVILIGWEASYTYNAAPKVESDLVSNTSVMDLVISSANCGNGTVEPLLLEVCDPPGAQGGCNNGFTCNATCSACIISGTPTGTAGDVFILRDIKFPNVYQNSDIVADAVVENKRMDLTTSGTISFIIRDSKGALVLGFAPQNFSFSSSMETVRLTLQNPCSGTACAFTTGETYTLYATAVQFNDPDPNPPNLSEIIIANNSGFKTFTTLEAPQTYSIPDSPWWMSVLVFGMIAGWLFISARKNEN